MAVPLLFRRLDESALRMRGAGSPGSSVPGAPLKHGSVGSVSVLRCGWFTPSHHDQPGPAPYSQRSCAMVAGAFFSIEKEMSFTFPERAGTIVDLMGRRGSVPAHAQPVLARGERLPRLAGANGTVARPIESRAWAGVRARWGAPSS